MVNFYMDSACTQPLEVLKFDESYVEDLYGGVLDNVVEVGTSVAKNIYAKNNDSDVVIISRVELESPFMTAIPEKARLAMNEVTPIMVKLSPTLEGLHTLEAIENPEEKQMAKEKLLKSSIKLHLYKITMP